MSNQIIKSIIEWNRYATVILKFSFLLSMDAYILKCPEGIIYYPTVKLKFS